VQLLDPGKVIEVFEPTQRPCILEQPTPTLAADEAPRAKEVLHGMVSRRRAIRCG
jgi:hypothetical protein